MNDELIKKKKLLIAIQLVRRGGVELVAINFARHLNPEKFDITFLLVNPCGKNDIELKDELTEKGFKFVEIPETESSYLKSYKFINNLMLAEKYDIVHSHVLFFSGFVLKAAKKNGVKVRVAHSHAVKWNREENLPYKLYKSVMRNVLNKYSNRKLYCSEAAGDFLYGKKQSAKNGIFIENGIDTEQFAFNPENRSLIRTEFEIKDNEILIGHIGTIYRIKNQIFLVEILSELLKLNPNSKLLLVGEKLDVQPVLDKANELGVTDRIIFAGQRSDVSHIYQAMDIMIFPSLHEALPLSLIEAQASKLPCLISDTVTTEVKFNDNVDFMSLNETAAGWAERALELINMPRNAVDISKLKTNYDIKSVVNKLEKIYLS